MTQPMFSPYPPQQGLAASTMPLPAIPGPVIPMVGAQGVGPAPGGLAGATAPAPDPMASMPPAPVPASSMPMGPPAPAPLASMPENIGGSPAPSVEPNFMTSSGEAVVAPPPVVRPPVGVAGTKPAKAKPQAATGAEAGGATARGGGGGGDPRRAELGALREARKDSYDAMIKGYGDLAGRERTRQGEMEDLYKDAITQRTIANGVTAWHNQQLAEHDKAANEQTAKELDGIADERRKVAGMKVDANRFAKNLGTGQKIAGLLGAAFSGFAAGMAGRDSNYIGMIERAIDRDIDTQKADIANARAGLAERMNVYGMLRAKLGDERAAKLALKQAHLDYTGNLLATAKEKMDSVTQKQTADKMIMEIDAAKERIGNEYGSARIGEIKGELAAEAAAQAAAVKEARRQFEWGEEHNVKLLEAEGKAGAGAASRDETFVKPLGGYVASKEQANKLMAGLDAADRMENAGNRLLDLIEKGDRTGEASGELEAAANDMVLGGKDKDNLGALSEADLTLMPTSAAQVHDWFRKGQVGKIKETINFLRSMRARARKNYLVRDLHGNDLRDELVQSEGAAPARPPGAVPKGLRRVGKVAQ